MFAKLSTLALALPLVSALTINPLVGATTGGTVTITWTASTTDPATFSIELVNTAFHNQFAVANNVPTAQGQITIQLPQVPVDNINTVYSQSGDFSVGAASSASTTAASTTAATTATSISSGTFTTPSVTATSPVSSASAAVSTASSSTASSTPSVLSSSGAASFKLVGMAPAAALVLSAVAGAAMVF
ncbi:hypothetical protein J3R83DRAFT_7571 [Lanmaoa asiatica]|nr:hypothetical protein J3R83DRAFT_7571 [Lanmaoa asiatica]